MRRLTGRRVQAYRLPARLRPAGRAASGSPHGSGVARRRSINTMSCMRTARLIDSILVQSVLVLSLLANHREGPSTVIYVSIAHTSSRSTPVGARLHPAIPTPAARGSCWIDCVGPPVCFSKHPLRFGQKAALCDADATLRNTCNVTNE